ncbi:NLR family CARD domain-containing protein 4 [Holothuria leucospilota]|uniref:NLR family CARD domain-containing protein 4 n=1 Tax=Holothuria leucospilota TaxID=206669 RepID=A0A9Q1CTX4_HOLLE|nr:NLR family CARD domain-containing protein 4 [Holothuria leucospilota]
MISCSFDEGLTISWYNSTTLVGEYPLIHYTFSAKDGEGYESGEFDIHHNGSLIIKEVSLRHEHKYAVQYLHTTTEDPVTIYFSVVVIVKPEPPFPVTDQCGTVSSICFHEINSPTNLLCSVQNARPTVKLQWVTRTTSGDRNISYEFSTTHGETWFTSSALTTKVFYFSSHMALHACMAKSLPGVLDYEKVMVLVYKGKVDLSSVKPIKKNEELNSRLELPCSDDDVGFLIWKKNAKGLSETFDEILLYSILIGESYTQMLVADVNVEENGVLVVPQLRLEHEGTYSCFYGNGLTDGVTVYEVLAYVNPTPPYPVIKGCNHQQPCVLEVGYDGTITCTVQGIRPQVQLDWVTLNEKDSFLIDFENHRFSSVPNGDLFDISISSTYLITDKSITRMTLVCSISGSDIWDTIMEFDLHFVTDDNTAKSDASKKKLLLLLLVVIVPLALVVLFGYCILRKVLRLRKGKRKKKEQSIPSAVDYETEEMLSNYQHEEEEIMRKKQLFVDQLQHKYETWCNSVQPIPYIRDKCCVDTIFVESGLEFLTSSSTLLREQRQWTRFQSYQDLFQDPRIKAKRLILEGDPGYGKSTLTLQFAYDWCNTVPASPLSDIEMFILLRLRQLRGIKSIYKAIKQYLLPVDSTLSEDDVKFVLQSSFSAVIFLDGFDEYAAGTSDENGDVMNIIRFEMFQDFDVVLTTRSSFLPRSIPPQTKRVRLTGFDANARSCYIRKAVVGDDDEAAGQIERNLQENPILSDLCQVPLLFVIFAHMTHGRDQFRRLNSVTSFFKYMITSFHSHMKNKLDEKEIQEFEKFEQNHCELDKVAFEALGGNNQSIVWTKQELSKEIGQEFYKKYCRTGILVEEEVMKMIDDPNFITSGPIHYTTEVRFYHKLFCEWYAAHYLAEYLKQCTSADLNKFLPQLHPYNLQYLYRFTCGLNPDSAEKIIDYLTKMEGGDKFAILCILEQSGKVDDIPIEYLQLHMCFAAVDLPNGDILLDSGLRLSSSMQVKRLGVDLLSREMTSEEVEEILQFALTCPALEILAFGGCMAPRSFSVGPTLSSLHSKNIQVGWRCSTESPFYILNLVSGLWEVRMALLLFWNILRILIMEQKC